MAISGVGGYSSNYQTHNISAILTLAAGDWVDVRGGINSGTVTMHQESSFFGYLLG
jgi:homogentisate 1,2-dioxygenase